MANNWTPEPLVKAGYAVAWMRYRAEVNNSDGSALKERRDRGASCSTAGRSNNVTQQMMDEEPAETRSRTDMTIANERIGRIKTPILVMGRINDDNEPQFRLSYEIGKELGKPFEWKQYEHAAHDLLISMAV